jgi:uncharacterized protein YdiU (UPF0061 family)
MAALKVPTSRALSITHLPDLEVIRERRETGAVVCRIAPSWLRIGSFELLQSRDDWDALLQLTRYAGERVFGLDLQKDGPQVARQVLKEVAIRNAYMVAGWQVQGFMHGVINTDNVSILGLTIDYGPYAFMDGKSRLPNRHFRFIYGQSSLSGTFATTQTIWAATLIGRNQAWSSLQSRSLAWRWRSSLAPKWSWAN